MTCQSMRVICVKFQLKKKSSLSSSVSYTYTLQPLYNMVRYNTVLDLTRFKDGFQKCIDYIENDHKWSFFNIIYTCLFGYNKVV